MSLHAMSDVSWRCDVERSLKNRLVGFLRPGLLSVALVLLSVLLTSTSLAGQGIEGDPALEARTEDRESWNRQFAFLTSCEDYLRAGEAQRRWYIAGINQAFFYAVEMVAIEVEMGLVVEAAGGDAVASTQIPAAQAAGSVLNGMLPSQQVDLGELSQQIAVRCQGADRPSLPVVRFYREAM